jgi:HK97 family phage major capsid protein
MASKYNELKQREHELTKELRDLAGRLEADGRAMTDEERVRRTEILEEVTRLRETIAFLDEQRERDRSAVAAEDPNSLAERAAAGREVTQKTGEKVFGSLGAWLQAVVNATINHDFSDRTRLINAAAIGSGEAIDSDGGFLVPVDFAAGIERRMQEMGQIMSRVDWVDVAGNGLVMKVINETSRATGSRWGGVQGYWVDEGTAPDASRPRFETIELKLRKAAALGYATEELLQDAPAMSSIYETAFAEELTWMVENGFYRGTGAGQPMGILNADCLVIVAAEAGQAAASIEPENIVKMFARMPSRNRANAAWFINQDIEPELFLLTLAIGTGGVPLYMPPNGLAQSPFGTLIGRPVIPIEYASTLGTLGDIVLVDWSQYAAIRKGGVQQASSIHVRFTQGETAFRATYRVDGQPKWKNDLTPANGTNDLSPFVALATRS